MVSLDIQTMLYFIGLGLGDERDITLRGLDAVRDSQKVYLESYTSLLGVDKASLVSFLLLCPYHYPLNTRKRLLLLTANL